MTHNSCCAAFLNSERREVGGIVGGETLNDTNTIEKYQGNQRVHIHFFKRSKNINF